MENVFVTDAQMRSSLAVIRSLGKKGLNVTAGDETVFTTGFFSKYCNHRVIYPSPKKAKKEFIDYLLVELKKKEYSVIFPVADACLLPLIEHEAEISKYSKLALPPRQTFMKAFDKGITLKIAIENGIPAPKTYFINDLNDFENIRNELEYPLIIKPRISSGSRGVELCKMPEELETKFVKIFTEHGPLLIQEYIPSSEEIGVYALFNFDSEPRAYTVQKRIRSYPVSGGPSTLRKTILNDEAVEIAFKLLKTIGWVGVAMVEFRIDSRDNIPKLMEVNPRFWGSLQLSILSGVDFPFLLYKMLTEGDVEPTMNYKENVECRWMLPGDILWFLSAPNKLKNLPEFLKFNTNDDILSLEDPGPTLGFILASLRYSIDIEMWKFVLRR
jgi:predicted ATP-grasp superfamily ATP-dependent carboligase